MVLFLIASAWTQKTKVSTIRSKAFVYATKWLHWLLQSLKIKSKGTQINRAKLKTLLIFMPCFPVLHTSPQTLISREATAAMTIRNQSREYRYWNCDLTWLPDTGDEMAFTQRHLCQVKGICQGRTVGNVALRSTKGSWWISLRQSISVPVSIRRW